MELLLAIIIVLGATLGITVYYAMVVVVLWGWFIVPFGLPELTIAHAVGLTLLVNMYRTDMKAGAKGEDEWQTMLANVMLKPLIALGIGYVAKSLMGM